VTRGIRFFFETIRFPITTLLNPFEYSCFTHIFSYPRPTIKRVRFCFPSVT